MPQCPCGAVVDHATHVVDMGMGKKDALAIHCAGGTSSNVECKPETGQLNAGFQSTDADRVHIDATPFKHVVSLPRPARYARFMRIEEVLADFKTRSGSAPLPWAVYWLARPLPVAHSVLQTDDPVERALLGLAEATDPAEEADLGRAVLLGRARAAEGRLSPKQAQALEIRAEGDPTWWVPACRLHLELSGERRTEARRRLARQILPYVMPGEIHATQVEVLAGGEQILGALHVDWSRKLSGLVLDAMVLDLRAVGLWFWPVLQYLGERQTSRTLARLAKARRVPEGGRGLLAAYLWRTGLPWELLIRDASQIDRLVCVLAQATLRQGDEGSRLPRNRIRDAP